MSNLNLGQLSHAALTKRLADRSTLKLGYETEAHRSVKGSFLIRHHRSYIADIGQDYVTIDNDGWHTRTTADRLNKVLREVGADHYAVRIKNGRMALIEYHTGDRLNVAHVYPMENRTFHFSRTSSTSPFILHT